MTRAIYYPAADRTTQWYGDGNAIVAPNKVLWHTTEGAGGFPDYSGGTMAPNLTYDPWVHQWRQHFRLDGTSRALANGSGYQTNRQGTVQVEIACTNGWNAAAVAKGRAVWMLDDRAIADLAAFSRFMSDEWGVPLSRGVDFLPYPQSNTAPKLSSAAFTAYRGHLAHMHAPFNDHSDTGALPIDRILAVAGGAKQEDDMPSPQDLWNYPIQVGVSDGKPVFGTAAQLLAQQNQQDYAQNAALKSLSDALARLTSAVASGAEISGDDVRQWIKEGIAESVKVTGTLEVSPADAPADSPHGA